MGIHNLSIKWQLAIICILLVVLPVVTVGILSYRTSKQELFSSIEKKLGESKPLW